MAYIAQELDIEEIFDLARCSRHFMYMMQEENFCRGIVLMKARHTTEAQEAKQSGYSRALRRLAKCRQAFSQASPYLVGIVGVADSYLFVRGKLCYVIEARPKRWLRILDLHASPDAELVIDIPELVSTAIPQSSKSRKYKFRTLYHAHGFTTCLFSFALPTTENWLLILRTQGKECAIVEKYRLESTSKIFVRNNAYFLYFGTHSEDGADGFRKWAIKGFDLTEGSWFPNKMHLSNLVGCDIGSTVCFEIYDNHFYGLSNQTAFEIEEIDWTSFYYCFRFPLDSPDPKKTQVMKKQDSWRRQHSEGPIDDRWGFLSLEQDEASGNIMIVECRKEWLVGFRGSRRTYYTQRAIFGEHQEGADESDSASPDASEALADMTTSLSKLDNQSMQERSPHCVHPGDDSSVASLLTRSKTSLCAYHRCSQTFVDLLDDSPFGHSGAQTLRLRTGHRRLNPTSGVASSFRSSDLASSIDSKITELYQENEIFAWPPYQVRSDQQSCLNKVHELLNPSGHMGCSTAVCDEHGLIYATSEDPKAVKALIYIGFDPGVKLGGTTYGIDLLGQRENATRHPADRPIICPTKTAVHHKPGHTAVDIGNRKGKETNGTFLPNVATKSLMVDPSNYTLQLPERVNDWAKYERAMHYDLFGKYSFAF
ncbi:hypothetical protein F5Y15DRAFT_410477 [Xylariaceae sp. FL0016]|nr:hypothetical protein F5Y15DRAFT_410477 [Xylariaceae sp. FL0016]